MAGWLRVMNNPGNRKRYCACNCDIHSAVKELNYTSMRHYVWLTRTRDNCPICGYRAVALTPLGKSTFESYLIEK